MAEPSKSKLKSLLKLSPVWVPDPAMVVPLKFAAAMLARPAELLDLDSVVLTFIALGAGLDEDALETWLSADVALGDAPLKAARQLRSDQAL